MSVFSMYFRLGIDHILDLNGYDHILFLIVLCAAYSFKQWKNILFLITAFTIGHCTTLVLASFNQIQISAKWIEFLIPITILITSLSNILQKKELVSKQMHLVKYLVTLLFGLIHGLGFSNYLRMLLGSELSIIKPLFAFNLGIELSQIFVVGIFFLITSLLVYLLSFNKRELNLMLSGAGLGISLILIIERFPI